MQHILIICGGQSAEHEISIISARNVMKFLNSDIYIPVMVVISRSGCWYLIKDIEYFENLKACNDDSVEGELCTLIRTVDRTILLSYHTKEEIIVHAAFPLVHGPMGEDGTLQGLLELMSLPYVGPSVVASAVCMDKEHSKLCLQNANLPIVPFLSIQDDSNFCSYREASEKLGSNTLIVKTAVMGSSIGVSKVRSEIDYNAAMTEAFKYGFKVLIEKCIPCREIECAVLGNINPKASVLGEIRPNHDFYTYEAKYLDPNGADLIIPAPLDEGLSTKIRDLAVRAFKASGCLGMSRVDFLIDINNDDIYINELNTIPGFTSISMYPKLWEASDISYTNLITQLIIYAFEAYQLKHSFSLKPE